MRYPRVRWLALAALALLPHGIALAADTIPSNRTTTVTLALDRELQVSSYIDSAVDKDWWRVSLTAGKAYVLRGVSNMCGTTMTVYNRFGAKLKSIPCHGLYVGGLEFIPTYTGVHYVEYAANGKATSYPHYYYADALNDCAGSKATTCTQPLDLDYSTRLQTRGDSDWRSMNLREGQTYTVAATEGNTFFLSVRRSDGTILRFTSGYSPRLVFKAPVSDRYFIEVKSTRDTQFGSNLAQYIVATGGVAARAAGTHADRAFGDHAPRTLDAAKAAAGKENTD
jgi:hypothetical protein